MEDLIIEKLIQNKLLELLDIIEINRIDYINKPYSDEYLHQIRVSIRKIRAICSLMERYFQDDYANQCKKSFSIIAKYTNEARDIDVHLQNLDSYKQILQNKDDDLNTLKEYLLKQQELQIQSLKAFFQSEKCVYILVKFKSYLCSHNLIKPEKTNINDNLKETVLKIYGKIIKKGIKLKTQSENKKFHKLRVEFKKIRYLIELLKPLYDVEIYDKILNDFKKVQDILGQFNDYEVQQKKLRELPDVLKLTKVETLSIELLIKHLKMEQIELKSKFHKQFVQFSHEHFEQLLINF